MRDESEAAVACDFPSTHWSRVTQAGVPDEDARRAALRALLTDYLPALKRHLVRNRRYTPDDAADVVHSFITERVLVDDLIARADQRRGRFRAFLAVSLDRFATNQLRYHRAQRRTPKGRVSINDPTVEERASTVNPSDSFDVAWARELLSRALSLMKDHCRAASRPDLWRVFEGRVLRPALAQEQPVPYRQLVDELRFESPAQASNALVTANRTFVRILRSLIGQYEPDDAAIDEEIVDLRRILSRAGAGSSDPLGICP